MMNNKFILSFYLLIIAITCVSRADLLSSIGQEEEGSKCYVGVLNTVIDEQALPQSDFTSSKASDAIKAICPKLKDTCCSEDNLNDLKDQFINGLTELFKIDTTHKEMYKNFLIRKSEIEAITVNDVDQLANCIDKEEVEQLKLYFNNITSEEYQAHESLSKGLLIISQLYSGFACEICDVGAEGLFTQTSQMIVNISNIQVLNKALVHIVDYYKYVNKISLAAKLYSCKIHDAGKEYDFSLKIDAIDKLRPTLVECSNLTPTLALNKKECIEFAEGTSLTTSFDLFILSFPFMKSMNKLFRDGDKQVEEDSGLNRTHTVYYREGQVVFYKNEETDNININKPKIQFTVDGGLKMDTNKMSNSIYGSVRIIGVSLIVVLMQLF